MSKCIIIGNMALRENTPDRQGDSFCRRSLERAYNQIKKGDPVFNHFRDDLPPIGKILDTKYITGKGLIIRAEVFDDKMIKSMKNDLITTIRGRTQCHGKNEDGIRVIKDLEIISVSIIPKTWGVYE